MLGLQRNGSEYFWDDGSALDYSALGNLVRYGNINNYDYFRASRYVDYYRFEKSWPSLGLAVCQIKPF